MRKQESKQTEGRHIPVRGLWANYAKIGFVILLAIGVGIIWFTSNYQFEGAYTDNIESIYPDLYFSENITKYEMKVIEDLMFVTKPFYLHGIKKISIEERGEKEGVPGTFYSGPKEIKIYPRILQEEFPNIWEIYLMGVWCHEIMHFWMSYDDIPYTEEEGYKAGHRIVDDLAKDYACLEKKLLRDYYLSVY